jgi:GNAT superfamily N-acetyltransferase
MSLHVVKKINPDRCNKLVDLLYNNFIDLATYKELSHNKQELTRLVTDEKAKIIFLMINKKIAAYLVGEEKDLADGRRVFYISYLYTAKQFRGKGLATKLLNYVEEFAKKANYNGVLLTYDTEDDTSKSFYENRGYMHDFVLRNYGKFDVIYKES